MKKSLIDKYNVAGPRYTSYPTVPYWIDDTFSIKAWKTSLRRAFEESNDTDGLSIYIHLPFCESLCTFCGCHKRITKQHSVEIPYINAVVKEWDLYCDLLPTKPKIKEMHFGGGTPTFFSPTHLSLLINCILRRATLADDYEFSFEGHPNKTTEEHLQTFYDLGFRRVSFGVQDYNETVQKAIHRIQPFENVKKVTEQAKAVGYISVGHDLIFGLPFQTEEHVKATIAKTKQLKPDRIAFYSYAHVPWLKGNGQRGFDESHLPSGEAKRQQYELGKTLLFEAGYQEIGMDHFALKSDSLYQSMIAHKLHRNFMGYTASKTKAMIGLGVSAISDSWYGFAQNVKNVEDYYNLIDQNILPVVKGHILNAEDLVIRKHILNLMCSFETDWTPADLCSKELAQIMEDLDEMEQDGLLVRDVCQLTITEKGKPFVRNVCMAFDLHLKRKRPETQLFSMTV